MLYFGCWVAMTGGSMKNFFSKLIVLTFILTAPLSFTGDRCPDFKPDCVRISFVEITETKTAAHYRASPRQYIRQSDAPIVAACPAKIVKSTASKSFQQRQLELSLGRAPPCRA